MKYTTLLSSRIIRDTIEPVISDLRKCAFIIDDSVYKRNGSKHVELLAKILTMQQKVSEWGSDADLGLV